MYTLPIQKDQPHRRGMTLLVVLALMVTFALLVTAFMVIVSQTRRTAEIYAQRLISSGSGMPRGNEADVAFELLLTGSASLDNVLAPFSILENLHGTLNNPAALFTEDDDGIPFALRPNILAPNDDGEAEYKEWLLDSDVSLRSDYTAPDYMTMFLAWNDFNDDTLQRIIPSFHRPQLVKYWSDNDPDAFKPNVLRKYILRPLPTDHPKFTGSNPAASVSNLKNFLTAGPWDVDNTGNGVHDGIWLDIGLELISDPATGLDYKPLVSFHVIDLDGRINVNTTGNLEQTPDNTVNAGVRGMGLGTADLSSPLLTSGVLTERYGTDGVPGDETALAALSPAALDDILRRWHGINYQAYTEGGLMADWFGTTPVEFDELGNRRAGTQIPPTSIPYFIPYLMNPYTNRRGDTPFDVNDMESLSRSLLEIDYNRLSHDFRALLDNSYEPSNPALTRSDLGYSLTTRSSDIPITARFLRTNGGGYETLRERVDRLTADDTEASLLWGLLPKEITEHGEKVDINRLTLLPEWDTHWNPNATPEAKNALLVEKFKFAQEIFYLLRVLYHDEIQGDAEALERFAQWSVNLIDFIDPDDVMTPFIFRTDDTPEDCTRLIEDLLAEKLDLEDNYMLIWGFEKSEVVITETFAFHNRGIVANANNDNYSVFRQHLRPQGVLFVKLYRQGNLQRSYSANSLVDTKDDENSKILDLAARTGTNSGDYVWRLAIGEATKTEAGKFKWNDDDHPERNALFQLLTPDDGIKYPQFYQWLDVDDKQYHPDLGQPERFIWFGSNLDFPKADNEIKRRSYANTGFTNTGGAGNTVPLLPDSYLIIAPAEVTVFSPSTPQSVSIDLRGTMARIMLAETQPGNPAARVNVSEPLPAPADTLSNAYPPLTHGNNPDSATLMPFDGRLDGTIPRQRGTIPCYKTICLQRLADPTRPHDPICNPYITVDWNMIDLHVFNSAGRQNQNRQIEEGDIPKDANMRISSRQGQWKDVDAVSNIWDKILSPSDLTDNWAGLESNVYGIDENGFVSTVPKHTLVKTDSPTPLLHFPWHDAPFMNTGELMLVPSSAPGRFGVEFHDNGKGEPFFGDDPRYSYNGISPYAYLAGTPSHSIGTPLERLFDFVHVPTKFAETRRPNRTVYREPGKINLNTVTKRGWNALIRSRPEEFPDYDTFRTYREAKQNDFSGAFGNVTLFDVIKDLSLSLIADDADNPYLALEKAMRLSDVTTTRSNVFAIWITVGYFEVEQFANRTALLTEYPALTHIDSDAMFQAVYPDGCILGAEKGLDDGTVVRYRSFYLIDRSAPIDFERGKPLEEIDDIDNVILQEVLLE